MNPLISVIIPVYNVEKYLEKCVDSVITQTYKNFEVILVDDGSTDKSGEICDFFSEKYEYIRTIHKTNGGLADSRNTGLEEAKGEYVYFLDSDDWIEKYALEVLVRQACIENLDVLLFDSRVVDENGKDILDKSHYMRYYRLGDYRGIYSGQEMFAKMIRNKEHYSSVPLLFIKRKAIKILFENILHEDELFTIQLLYSSKRVGYCPEILYVRRMRYGSIMTIPKTPMHYLGMLGVIRGILSIPNCDKNCIRYCCTMYQCSILIYNQLSNNDRIKIVDEKKKILIYFKKNNYYDSNRLKMLCLFSFLYPSYNHIFNEPNQTILSYYLNKVVLLRRYSLILDQLEHIDGKRYFILGTPIHGNLGDHAIAIAQRKMLEKIDPDAPIIEINMSVYRTLKRN